MVAGGDSRGSPSGLMNEERERAVVTMVKLAPAENVLGGMQASAYVCRLHAARIDGGLTHG